MPLRSSMACGVSLPALADTATGTSVRQQQPVRVCGRVLRHPVAQDLPVDAHRYFQYLTLKLAAHIHARFTTRYDLLTIISIRSLSPASLRCISRSSTGLYM